MEPQTQPVRWNSTAVLVAFDKPATATSWLWYWRQQGILPSPTKVFGENVWTKEQVAQFAQALHARRSDIEVPHCLR